MGLYRIRHSTVYEYEKPVVLGHSMACVLPRDLRAQKLVNGSVLVEPKGGFTSQHVDYFGNRVVYVSVSNPHRRFALTADSTIDVTTTTPYKDSPAWETARDVFDVNSTDTTEKQGALHGVSEYRLPSPMVPLLDGPAEYARPSFTPERPALEALSDFMARIHTDFKYDSKATDVGTPISKVMALRSGVCQDFAHLFISGARSLGLATRYVSGYLETKPPPRRPKLRGADASHAWVGVWIPDLGWCDFDPTNNRIPDEQYVTLAWGRDFSDVSPLKGVIFGGGGHTVKVSVDVERL